MKNPLKKEYLNLYKEKAGGGYEFTGTYYRFQGQSFQKRFFLLAAVLGAIGALIVASGCLNAGGMRNSFYVIIPYIGEISACFALAWNAFKLLTKGERVKDYVYKTAYPRLPRIALAVAIFAGISFVCSLVFILLQGAEGGVLGCVLYLAFKLSIALTAILFRDLIIKTKYEAE